MSNTPRKNAPQEDKKQSSSMAKQSEPSSSTLTFSLVLVMLVILFVLIIVLFVATFSYLRTDASQLMSEENFKEFLEYSKWVFSGLITAFGAWIGAGAAYFFGKENLIESSRSTEEALRIQQGLTKQDHIRDIALTIMNKEFNFKSDKTVKDVKDALEAHPDYWWVPVLDIEGKGILENVIHASMFWQNKTELANDVQLSKIPEGISKDEKLSKLHGPAFFIKAALEDKIADVSRSMDKSGAVIGIVVDDNGKPSYWFTKQNLLTAEQA